MSRRVVWESGTPCNSCGEPMFDPEALYRHHHEPRECITLLAYRIRELEATVKGLVIDRR